MSVQSSLVWLGGRLPAMQADLRLFCLPYAGAGASVYRSWQGTMGPRIDVCPIQLPGRETRHSEAPLRSFDTLIPALGEALAPWVSRPFAVFGFSLGGLVAYELTRWLESRYEVSPVRLFVSARRAPHLPEPMDRLSHLPREEFIPAVQKRYGGIPQVILDTPELLDVFLPRLKADFELLDTYVHAPSAPVGCQISVFGGRGDTTVGEADLRAWEIHSRAGIRVRMMDGGHLFLQEQRAALVAAMVDDLRPQGVASGATARC